MAGITNVDSEKTVAGTKKTLSKAGQTVRSQARRVQEIKLSQNEQLTRNSSLASQSADTSPIERLREFRTRIGKEIIDVQARALYPESTKKVVETRESRDPHALYDLKRCADPSQTDSEMATLCEIARRAESGSLETAGSHLLHQMFPKK